MLGQTLKVFDVYEGGLVWVGLTWKRDDGGSEVHAISVDPEQIELVAKSSDEHPV